MEGFPAQTRFKYPWRHYQQRVLDQLEAHLADQHLHIVAPPGSGKTVLGLEVMRRLGKPTLICAPSLALRDQWVDRFCELFLATSTSPDWISTSLSEPRFLTVVTYQALHAALESKHGQKDTVLAKLRDCAISTLVLDEAHHLKNAWWRALMLVKEHLSPVVVGLTATPPYDVTGLEWQRYMTLNGDVDAEIAVPELVAAGDLCPHQDYIFFCSPTEQEAQLLDRAALKRRQFAKNVLEDAGIFSWLASQPWLITPLEHLDWIYEHLDVYIATLCLWRAAGRERCIEHQQILALENAVLPEFSPVHLALALQQLLDQKTPEYEALRERVAAQLRRAGLMHRGRVDIEDSERREKLLVNSAGKLQAVVQLAQHEWGQLGDGLRMVVLADFIRAEYLGQGDVHNSGALNKLGVIPLFEALRHHLSNIAPTDSCHMAVLTGQLVILPMHLLADLQRLVAETSETLVSLTPLACDERFGTLTLAGQEQKRIVHWITRLFELGRLHVLVGTSALLGEGWDAPSINTLVLASSVGSFVQSNQMRGRAIRVDKREPKKVANIWHLACVDKSAKTLSKALQLGEDFSLLVRRFKAFSGVSIVGDAVIENGIARLQLDSLLAGSDSVTQANHKMLSVASERGEMHSRWQAAVLSGANFLEGIAAPYVGEKSYKADKEFVLTRSLAHFFALLMVSLSIWFDLMPLLVSRLLARVQDGKAIVICLVALLSFSALYFGVRFFNYFRLWLAYRDIGQDLHAIGEALLESLAAAGLVATQVADFMLTVDVDEWGVSQLYISGGERHERELFMASLTEIIAPVDNPRYLIVRRSVLLRLLTQRDYHAVPYCLANQKKRAQHFAEAWLRQVGSSDLIYTRSLEGRARLHRARLANLAHQLKAPIERARRWGF
ncbi:DEAD/DEAH box helicase family protein [Simiduia curdlanivorans]|uniref:DEAD/DEAH box helicase family protein n=1 Tax=Simiduia curdlanivorans TaxID=1492769 RepID=A0ABV8V3Z7_9GAMM|nr:DEAD/DEAH box helicase family protein [Simiduia curdlanivorans]MDN3641002.1 DEAD/DEAH box helicase family protein [Simiduia curdlanivorans]